MQARRVNKQNCTYQLSPQARRCKREMSMDLLRICDACSAIQIIYVKGKSCWQDIKITPTAFGSLWANLKCQKDQEVNLLNVIGLDCSELYHWGNNFSYCLAGSIFTSHRCVNQIYGNCRNVVFRHCQSNKTCLSIFEKFIFS